jgi:hypothetical protein
VGQRSIKKCEGFGLKPPTVGVPAEGGRKRPAPSIIEIAKRQAGGKAMSAAAKTAKNAKPNPPARAKAPQLGDKVANEESDDITSKLERLSAMFKEGLLDVGEFKAAKAAIKIVWTI